MTDILYQVRKEIASQYIAGEGIEVGALNAPLELPNGAKVKYVDRMSAKNLQQQYPELSALSVLDPDIIELLTT